MGSPSVLVTRFGHVRFTSATPLSNDYYHADLALSGSIPLEAKQLLAAAQAGWISGGVGSWRDKEYQGPDREEYDRLTDQPISAAVRGHLRWRKRIIGHSASRSSVMPKRVTSSKYSSVPDTAGSPRSSEGNSIPGAAISYYGIE